MGVGDGARVYRVGDHHEGRRNRKPGHGFDARGQGNCPRVQWSNLDAFVCFPTVGSLPHREGQAGCLSGDVHRRRLRKRHATRVMGQAPARTESAAFFSRQLRRVHRPWITRPRRASPEQQSGSRQPVCTAGCPWSRDPRSTPGDRSIGAVPTGSALGSQHGDVHDQSRDSAAEREGPPTGGGNAAS